MLLHLPMTVALLTALSTSWVHHPECVQSSLSLWSLETSAVTSSKCQFSVACVFWSCLGPSACKLLGTGQDPVLFILFFKSLARVSWVGFPGTQTLRIVPRRVGQRRAKLSTVTSGASACLWGPLELELSLVSVLHWGRGPGLFPCDYQSLDVGCPGKGCDFRWCLEQLGRGI